MRESGFAAEAAKAEQGVGGEALSDRLLDAICLLGPVSRCRERLAKYRVAGLDLQSCGRPWGSKAREKSSQRSANRGDAILDRIVHSAHRLELKGESLRKLRAVKNAKLDEATVN